MSSTPLSDVETAHQVERLLPVGVGLVGELDPGSSRQNRSGTRAKKPRDAMPSAMSRITLVDAENLLDDDDAGAAARTRTGEIAAEIRRPCL